MGGRVRVVRDDRDEDGLRVEHVAPDGPSVPQPETADADLLIDRPDLGDGMQTQVRAGDVIPLGLAHFPRRPVGEAVRRESKSSRSSTAAKSRAQQPRKR